MHPLVQLARDAVEQYVRHGKILTPDENELPREMRRSAGVFVCIKRQGRLRGCVGTFQPCESTIARETIRNAISASTRDPRFPCVQSSELSTLVYTVDVLSSPVAVSDRKMLDPRKYGIIVRAGAKRGLLLPDLDGIETVEHQISIASEKAGIRPDEEVELSSFTVERHC